MSGFTETRYATGRASAALAAYRRIRLDSNLELAYCSDSSTDCIGSTDKPALAADEYVSYVSRTAQGTVLLEASEAITAGAACYAAANGKVAATGTVLVGEPMAAAGADGDIIEVMLSPAAILGAIARSALTQDDLKVYGIELENFRVTATGALLGTAAGTPANAFGIAYGTHGTASPIIQGEAASGNTKTNRCRQNFTLPAEYVDGQTVTLRVKCAETVGAATVSTTIDAEVHEHDGDGTVSADICATAAQDVAGATAANKDFTITPTGLAAGDTLDIELTGVTTDTGGVVGTVLEIYAVQLLLDVKG